MLCFRRFTTVRFVLVPDLERDDVHPLQAPGDERAVGCEDELHLGQGFGHCVDDLHLPLRVQVQIDFVHQDYALVFDQLLAEGQP